MNHDTPSHLVRSADDIRRNLITFNAEARTAEIAMLRRILSTTTYWVYDQSIDLFGPSKFTGIRDISMDRYSALLREAAERESVPGFDGFASRRVIERFLEKSFSESSDLSANLELWGTDLMGVSPFGGVDREKWLFVTVMDQVGGRRGFSAIATEESTPDLSTAIRAAVSTGAFDPTTVVDSREKVLAAITRRRGQPGFRKMMLSAYEGRCAVTGCDAPAALEAAHVTPYRGPETNHPLNGLLLRSDIHTLFDLGLLAVDADSMTILVAPELSQTEYGQLAGKALSTPKDSLLHPLPDCLKQHRDGSKCR